MTNFVEKNILQGGTFHPVLEINLLEIFKFFYFMLKVKKIKIQYPHADFLPSTPMGPIFIYIYINIYIYIYIYI